MDYGEKRKFFEKRRSALDLERSTFVPTWKELSEYLTPRRGRFFISDRNKGDKRYRAIINSRATQAIKQARAGIVAGIMSPSRPWYGLATEDPALMDIQEVRVWLDQVRARMNTVFNRSNLYNTAPIMVGELLTFATGAMSHLDDDETVARFQAHTVGSYLIGQDDRGEVDTFVREYEMQISPMIKAFGYDNCSDFVKRCYDNGKYDEWAPVVNYVGDNPSRDFNRAGSKYKLISSCYYEPGNKNQDQFLRESGFDEFPVYVPRWDLTGEDVWGTDCPGMVALGDVKQLQLEEKRKAQAIEKMVNPPLKGPTSLRNVPVSALPGGLTIFDAEQGRNSLEPIYQVDPRITELKDDMAQIEKRINEAFFVDLFFAITQMEGIQPRNQLELTQRNQERLLQLGPVLERLQSEFLSKLIERTFNQLARKNLLPPVPEVLDGQPLKVDFVSSLAMAQRSAEVDGINRMRLYVSELVQSGFPEAIDKFDADQSIDKMSLIMGVPAEIIRSDEAVAQRREARLQEAQQQAEQQQAVAATEQLVQISRR